MSSVGGILRQERLRRNLGLDQISRELRIAPRFLEAIEDDRFDLLPGGVFARSFVRQYARLLNLDEEALASEVQRTLEPAPLLAPESPNLPPIEQIHVPKIDLWQTVGDRRSLNPSSTLQALALVIIVMLVCSGLYAFWQHSRRPPVTTALNAAPPAGANQSPAAEPKSARSQTSANPALPATASPQSEDRPETRSEAPRQAPPLGASGDASRAATGPAGPPVRIELKAEEPVWVLARIDGKYAFSGTLQPNEIRDLQAGRILLRLGNAGGVSIKMNGRDIGAVGPRGQVREVQFTSGGFQIVAAPKPSLPLDNPI
jgi:cytoskeleton protein RodZ